MNRRKFLSGAALGAAALAAHAVTGVSPATYFLPEDTARAKDRFSFVHMTDLHIEPERHAATGCAKCITRINALAPEFVVCGGDLVYDAGEVGYPRAKQLYDLYQETLKPLNARVHTVIGNHDLFGVVPKSGAVPDDPHFGKRIFEERVGPRYSSFDYKGWHFVLLDSIGTRSGRDFIGYVDAAQLDWLRADLAGMRPGTPLVVATHVPLVSAVLQIVADRGKNAETYLVTNSREVLEVLWPYRPKAVLQGHTHIRETILYDGCQFITSGAVCGNWWKGPREGHPEGFGVLTVQGDEIHWRYETYGFVADPV
jgi:Icc protein